MKLTACWRRPEVAAGIWILLLAFITVAAPSSRSQSNDAPPRSVLCTLRAVDSAHRTIVVLTGVGHSVRAIRMRLAPTCRIEAARRLVGLEGLRIGQVVRVRYATAPLKDAVPRETALSIEVMTDARGGAR